jgi:hypothetical protein
MSRIASMLACFAVASVFSFGAQAFPVSPAPATQVAAPEIILVRGFCGLGFHRGPYGGCVRNGVPYGYVAPPVYVGPPVYAAPPVYVGPPVYAAPPVVVPRACPYGYYFYAPYGRCVPTP